MAGLPGASGTDLLVAYSSRLKSHVFNTSPVKHRNSRVGSQHDSNIVDLQYSVSAIKN